MVLKNMLVNYGILAACAATGVAGMLRESQGWWLLSLLLLGASVLFEWRRFRCPCCHRKIHWLYYRPGKCCPHCGSQLDEEP